MYAFEKTAELLSKTNSELKAQHQVAAKALNSLVESQFSLLSQGLGTAFTAAEKLPLADKPLVASTRTELKQGLEKVVGVSQAYTQKGVELFETQLPVVIDKGFSYAALALSQVESVTENVVTLSVSALEQAKKNETLKPAIEQAEQIAEQLFKKIGVKGEVSAKAAKKPAAKKAAPRAKKAAAAPKASV
ncbi:MAG TPA: hypothetical protein VGE55_09500 [Limnobacter sp.]|uniref:hypothetical protein n=1 Tax=Limnobacter sp. TaxID=2003368 RepID=UPI002ED90657